MPVEFPKVDDIPLADSPLVEVVCQVRFPPVLRLAETPPVDFQDKVKARFPLYEVQRGAWVEPQTIKSGDSVKLGPPTHQFITADKTCTAALSTDFYALTTAAYKDWPQFQEDLKLVARAASDVVDIPYATRVGVRYVNLIGTRFTESGNLEGLYELLRPELTAMLRTVAFLSPTVSVGQIVVPDGEGAMALRYGLVTAETGAEPGFQLDFDYYTEGQVGLDGLMERCKRYHDEIYRAFRWCIADGKLGAFGPIKAEGETER